SSSICPPGSSGGVNSGTSAAMGTRSADGSNRSMRRNAPRPARSPFQKAGTPTPSAETTPRPVIATRRSLDTLRSYVSRVPGCYAACKVGSSRIVQPLSIALVTDWAPPRIGGVERHVAGLARALALRGHHVHLYTTTHDASPIDGVTLHPIEATMFGDVAA